MIGSEQRSANLFAKGWIVNILGFVGHTCEWQPHNLAAVAGKQPQRTTGKRV